MEEARRLRDEDFDELMAACDTAKNAVKKDKAISRATRNISDDEVDVSTDDVPPPVRTTRAARPRDEQPESPLQKAEEPQPISQIPLQWREQNGHEEPLAQRLPTRGSTVARGPQG